MSLIAKIIGGKEINHIQSVSFQHQCMVTALKLITGMQIPKCSNNFGLDAKHKQKFEKLVELILYKPPLSTTAVELKKLLLLRSRETNIIIHTKYISKTGIFNNHGLLLLLMAYVRSNNVLKFTEIKCLYSSKHLL